MSGFPAPPATSYTNLTSIHYVGAYAPEYARHRVIQRGLRELGIAVQESIDRGFLPLRWARMAGTVQRISGSGPVIVGESGNYLTPVLLWARLLGHPVIFDPFVSLRMTADDRLVGVRQRLLAPLGELIDRVNNGAAGAILCDTAQTREYFVRQLGAPREKTFVVPVGAETELFRPRPGPERRSGPFRVLFYGSFIPLHGIDTIIHAAAIVQGHSDQVRFQLIGSGQTYEDMRRLAQRLQVKNVDFGPRSVAYTSLPDLIAAADLCLGIFADRPKTRRVVPHKLYQSAAMGIPVITADTPAVRDSFSTDEVVMIPAGSAEALAETILALLAAPERRRQLGQRGAAAVQARYSPRMIARHLLTACEAWYEH